MPVQFTLFGGTAVTIDEQPIELNARPRAVLVCLLLEPGQRISIAQVARFLWGDRPPKTHRNSVARFVADLRRGLGAYADRVETIDGCYRIRVEDGELDRQVIEAKLAEARAAAAHDLQAALDAITVAQGTSELPANALLGTHVEGVVASRSLEDLRAAVLDSYAELHLRAGRSTELVPILEAAVATYPYRERVWLHLIQALHQSGRAAEALRAGQRLRTVLGDVGLEPSDSVREVENQILVGSLPLPGAAGVADDATDSRNSDLHTISASFDEHRLVSIVGFPGVGKTFLASRVLADERLDGAVVHRLDLANVRGPSRLVPALGSVVGVPAAVEVKTTEDLAGHLVKDACLIVLDNADALRSEAARLVETILGTTIGVRVLVTARRPLAVSGEFVHRLGLLPTSTEPGGAEASVSPAAQFLATHAGLDLTDGPDPAVLEVVEAIASALHGHPDALRRAATATATLSLSELRQALDVSPAATSSDATASILDIIWSRMPPQAQTLLARVSVFAGSWSTEGTLEVCVDGADGAVAPLAHLVSRGMVSPVGDRFVLDEPVRTFAAARLSDRCETDVVMGRLVDWLRGLTSRWGIPEIGCLAEPSAILLPEAANIDDALEFLSNHGRCEELAWLAIRCCGMWINHGMSPAAQRWLPGVVADESISRAARSAAAAVLLEADLTVGRYETLAPWGEKVLLLADGETYDWVPMVSGFLAIWCNLVPMSRSSREFIELAEATAERSDSRDVNRALVRMRQAQLAHHRRDHDRAVDLFREALALVPSEGRLLLAIEMGETISLHNGGRTLEALESVGRWRSKVETDEWHYQIDIIRAIVVGSCGEPERATAELADALRRHKPISVWARADEFQMAFGLLAGMRGESGLSEELLASPLSGSPFLTSMVVEHLVVARGLDPAQGYADVNAELLARGRAVWDGRAEADGHADLAAWWQSGSRSESATTS